MQVLKTPSVQFNNITDFPYAENYVNYEGIDMHYVDEGEGEIILALHGEPSWCYLYRKFIPILSPKYRFIAPDFIGFGKSEKIVGVSNYTFDLHFNSLVHFMDTLDLNDITLVVQDWGGLLGLSLLGAYPERFKRVVIMNTFIPIGKPLKTFFKLWVAYSRYHPSLPIGKIIQWGTYQKLSKEVVAAYDAPFPDKRYKHGARAFPSLVPKNPNNPAVKYLKQARQTLSEWEKPALVLFSDKDQVLGGLEGFFFKLIPTADESEKVLIKDAGHFLQEEKGEEIANYIDAFMQK